MCVTPTLCVQGFIFPYKKSCVHLLNLEPRVGKRIHDIRGIFVSDDILEMGCSYFYDLVLPPAHAVAHAMAHTTRCVRPETLRP